MTTTTHDPWNGTFELVCREPATGKIDPSKLAQDHRKARLEMSGRGKDAFRAWCKANPTPKTARIYEERKDARTLAWEKARLAKIKAQPKIETPAPVKVSHAEQVAQQRAALFAAALSGKTNGPRDPRLPAAGTTLTRTHKGSKIEVKVLESGFRYDDRHFSSLSALASEITGSSTNGFRWFNLITKEG